MARFGAGRIPSGRPSPARVLLIVTGLWMPAPSRSARLWALGLDGAGALSAAGGGKGAFRTGWWRQVERRAGDRAARDAVDRRGGVGEGQLRERDQVAVDLQGVLVDVVDGVAGLVVAGVELRPGGAAPDGLLRGCLGHLGAGEQAPRGDPGLDEGLVVAA